MKDKQITDTKKIIIILAIVLVGMSLALLIAKVWNQQFLFRRPDRFMDYFKTLSVSRNVYESVGTGRGYFPFTYVLLNCISFLIPKWNISYALTFALFAIILVFFCMIFFKKMNLLGVLLITFLSYPMIFELDRANVEYLVLTFVLFFFIFYKKQKYKLAAILLAFPICMKLYPALFAILFLKDKKYKEFFLCVGFSIFTMIASFLLIGGNLENLPTALENFSFFTETISKTDAGIQYSHTIWCALNYISLSFANSLLPNVCMTIYTVIIAILALVLVAYIIFWEKEEWKAISILTIMMIIFPHVSFDYTLIYMYIPIIYFISAEKTKEHEGIVFAILFGLTIIPMNWFQVNVRNNTTLNLGLLIRPVILLSIIAIIVKNTIKNKKRLLMEG